MKAHFSFKNTTCRNSPCPPCLGREKIALRGKNSSRRSGYTLIELLVSTTITLILLGGIVQMFGTVGTAITDSRSMLETLERVRMATTRLQLDLEGLTVTPIPPRNPADGEGYLEIIEGPVMQIQVWNTGVTPNRLEYVDYPWDAVATYMQPSNHAQAMGANPLGLANGRPINPQTGNADTTVGDCDDIIMFTTRSKDKPFTGLWFDPVTSTQTTIQSDVAEVAWFIRGRTLYRRVLLVVPQEYNIYDPLNPNKLHFPGPAGTGKISRTGFYGKYDVSVRYENDFYANSLGDLTRRECRYGHPTTIFPFDSRGWGQYGLPTLRECSDSKWAAGSWPTPGTPNPNATVDYWMSNSSTLLSDNVLGTAPLNGTRIAEDVILTNVIGFDVKVWDHLTGDYVNLGQNGGNIATDLKTFGDTNSFLAGTATTARIYDTWSTHYETTGLPGLSVATYPPGRSNNGFDDVGWSGATNGVVDDDDEKIALPPYTVPLRGVQIKIRVFEPDSRQIKEVTILQNFLP